VPWVDASSGRAAKGLGAPASRRTERVPRHGRETPALPGFDRLRPYSSGVGSGRKEAKIGRVIRGSSTMLAITIPAFPHSLEFGVVVGDGGPDGVGKGGFARTQEPGRLTKVGMLVGCRLDCCGRKAIRQGLSQAGGGAKPGCRTGLRNPCEHCGADLAHFLSVSRSAPQGPGCWVPLRPGPHVRFVVTE